MIEEKAATIYVTRDGREFMNKKDAQCHEAGLDFEEWYEDEKLYGSYDGSSVHADDVLDWLRTHAAKLRLIIGG